MYTLTNMNTHMHTHTCKVQAQSKKQPQSLLKLITVGLQIKHIIFGLMIVVFRVGPRSHGTIQGGLQFNMIILGEIFLATKPSPCALVQILNISKC